MAHNSSLKDKLIVLIGGSGFLGGHIAQDLLEKGARLRVVSRNPEKAVKLKPLANLGQMQIGRCDVRDRRELEAAVTGADMVVYLVGSFGADQKALQTDAAGFAARIAAQEGAEAFVYVSALGADPKAESGYASTKGMGEAEVLKAFPTASIVRPSILFGEDDNFVHLFAGLVSTFPVLPIFGAEAQIQPLWVDDAAAAVVEILATPASHGGKVYEIAGPEVITMGELHSQIAHGQCKDTSFIPMPDIASTIFAKLPLTPMNSDQWALLKAGNKPSGDYPGIAKLGIAPKPLSLFLDKWMTRYRKHGRFTPSRSCQSS